MSRRYGAVALYSSLLALYPRAHRDEYGDVMVQLFTDRYRDERPTGDFFRFVRFWGSIFGDLIRTALPERTESAMSRFKTQWWKWAIGLFAAFQSVFLVESALALIVGSRGNEKVNGVVEVVQLAVVVATVSALVAGLMMMNSRPRLAGGLIAFGMLPVVAAGLVFFWFPPMWLVSVIGIYLVTRAFMEAGRLTRAAPATA